jgi:hypothetical protein
MKRVSSEMEIQRKGEGLWVCEEESIASFIKNLNRRSENAICRV